MPELQLYRRYTQYSVRFPTPPSVFPPNCLSYITHPQASRPRTTQRTTLPDSRRAHAQKRRTPQLCVQLRCSRVRVSGFTRMGHFVRAYARRMRLVVLSSGDVKLVAQGRRASSVVFRRSSCKSWWLCILVLHALLAAFFFAREWWIQQKQQKPIVVILHTPITKEREIARQ